MPIRQILHHKKRLASLPSRLGTAMSLTFFTVYSIIIDVYNILAPPFFSIVEHNIFCIKKTKSVNKLGLDPTGYPRIVEYRLKKG